MYYNVDVRFRSGNVIYLRGIESTDLNETHFIAEKEDGTNYVVNMFEVEYLKSVPIEEPKEEE